MRDSIHCSSGKQDRYEAELRDLEKDSLYMEIREKKESK